MTAAAQIPKARPILFGTSMVQALLRGAKTQTRRPLKLPEGVELDGVGENGKVAFGSRSNTPTGSHRIGCPFGGAGDRLWVRETWSPDGAADIYPHSGVWYRADCGLLEDPVVERAKHRPKDQLQDPWTCPEHGEKDTPGSCLLCHASVHGFKWRPAIHMKREHARIWLTIDHVKLERLSEITEGDAKAEGVLEGTSGHREPYQRLWDATYGETSPWDTDPMVWAICFRRIGRCL